MARYIDADKKIHIQVYNDEYEEFDVLEQTIAECLDSYTDEGCPDTADVQEVKHGKWETREEEVYGIVPTTFEVCSNCGKEYTSVFMAGCCADFEADVIHFHYCPYCGAKMDGKENEK